MSTAVTVH